MTADAGGREAVRAVLEPWRNVLGWGDQSLGHRLEEEFTKALEARVEAAEAERDRESAEWARRYDDAVQPLQRRCSEYIARAEAAEAQVAALLEADCAYRSRAYAVEQEHWPVDLDKKYETLLDLVDDPRVAAALRRVREDPGGAIQ